MPSLLDSWLTETDTIESSRLDRWLIDQEEEEKRLEEERLKIEEENRRKAEELKAEAARQARLQENLTFEDVKDTIVQFESKGDKNAEFINKDGTKDIGLYQINERWINNDITEEGEAPRKLQADGTTDPVYASIQENMRKVYPNWDGLDDDSRKSMLKIPEVNEEIARTLYDARGGGQWSSWAKIQDSLQTSLRGEALDTMVTDAISGSNPTLEDISSRINLDTDAYSVSESTASNIDYRTVKEKWLDRVEEAKSVKTFADAAKVYASDPIRLVPFINTSPDIKKVAQITSIMGRIDEATEEGKEPSLKDMQELYIWQLNNRSEKSWGNLVGTILGELPAFAGELFLTSGAYTAGKRATLKAGKFAIKKALSKKARNQTAEYLSKHGFIKGTAAFGKKSVEAIGGATIQAGAIEGASEALRVGTLGWAPGGRIRRGVMDRMMGDLPISGNEYGDLEAGIFKEGDDFDEALARSGMDYWIEIVSERSGGALKVFNGLGKYGRKVAMKYAWTKKMLELNPTKNVKEVNGLIDRVGWHGVFGEMFEEEVGRAARGVVYEIGMEDEGFEWKRPTLKELSAQFVAFMVPGAGFALARGRADEGMEPTETPPPFDPKNKEEVRQAIIERGARTEVVEKEGLYDVNVYVGDVLVDQSPGLKNFETARGVQKALDGTINELVSAKPVTKEGEKPWFQREAEEGREMVRAAEEMAEAVPTSEQITESLEKVYGEAEVAPVEEVPTPEAEAVEKKDYSKMLVKDLKSELINRDLSRAGLKADLIARLQEADKEAAPVAEVAPEAAPEVVEPVVEEVEEGKPGQAELPLVTPAVTPAVDEAPGVEDLTKLTMPELTKRVVAAGISIPDTGMSQEAMIEALTTKVEEKETPAPPVLTELDEAEEQERAKVADAASRLFDNLATKKFYDDTNPNYRLADKINDAAIIGADLIKRGAKSFKQFSTEMIKKVGKGVKPYLKKLYNAAKEYIKSPKIGLGIEIVNEKGERVIPVEHYTNMANLEKLKTEKFGTAKAGVEKGRSKEATFLNRVNLYPTGASPEGMFRKADYKYSSELPSGKLYDFYEDRLNMWDKSGGNPTKLENLIKDAGYSGFISTLSGEVGGQPAIAWFEDVETTGVERRMPGKEWAGIGLRGESAQAGAGIFRDVNLETPRNVKEFHHWAPISKEYVGLGKKVAGELGIHLSVETTAGGWIDPDTGQKITEPSVSFLIRNTKREDAELFADIMVANAPEEQHSVLISHYGEGNGGMEYVIRPTIDISGEKASRIAEKAYELGIPGEAIETRTGLIHIADYDLSQIDKVSELITFGKQEGIIDETTQIESEHIFREKEESLGNVERARNQGYNLRNGGRNLNKILDEWGGKKQKLTTESRKIAREILGKPISQKRLLLKNKPSPKEKKDFVYQWIFEHRANSKTKFLRDNTPSQERERGMSRHEYKKELSKIFDMGKRAHKKSLGVMLKEVQTRQGLGETFKSGKKMMDWYEGFYDYVKKRFGADADLITDFIAITSAGTGLRANVTLGLKAYSQYKLGEEVRSGRFFTDKKRGEALKRNIANAISNHEKGTSLKIGDRKITNFSNALKGDANAVVFDVWMGREFGFDMGKQKSLNESQYRKYESIIKDLADEWGVTPRQAQASIWFGIRGGHSPMHKADPGLEAVTYEQLLEEIMPNFTYTDKSGNKHSLTDLNKNTIVYLNGSFGLTPESLDAVGKALVDTGRYVYDNLSPSMQKLGNRLGVNAQNFKLKFAQFKNDAKEMTDATKRWFKKVVGQMKTWFKRNAKSLLESKPVQSAYNRLENMVTLKVVQDDFLGAMRATIESAEAKLEEGEQVVPSDTPVYKKFREAGSVDKVSEDSGVTGRFGQAFYLLSGRLKKVKGGMGVLRILRQYEKHVLTIEGDLRKSEPWFKFLNKLRPSKLRPWSLKNQEDWNQLEGALIRGDMDAILEIVDKHGQRDAYNSMREMLDEIYYRAINLTQEEKAEYDEILGRLAETRGTVPNSGWTVNKIKVWLTENGMEYTSQDKKQDLLDRTLDIKGMEEKVSQLETDEARFAKLDKKIIYNFPYWGDDASVYFPRTVIDPLAFNGMLTGVVGKGEMDKIKETIRERYNLSKEDSIPEGILAQALDNYLKTGKMRPGKPGAVLGRVIEKKTPKGITPEMMPYYADPVSSLLSYIHRMNESIAKQKLFGKGVDIDNPENAGHIGAFVEGLVTGENEFGIKIDRKEQAEIKDIFHARFAKGWGQFSGLIQGVKNITYMTTLIDIFTTMIQTGDLFVGAGYRGAASLNVSVTKNILRAFAGQIPLVNKLIRSPIDVRKYGMVRISAEFTNDAEFMGKALGTAFEMSGFAALDRIGKEALVNVTIERAQNEARKGKISRKTQNLIDDAFGGRAQEVIEQLKTGEITDDVISLAYWTLLEHQPVAESEMPAAYLRSGGARLFYQLKTWQLKQLSLWHSETVNMYRKGQKTQAIKNGIYMGMSLALAGAGPDALRDFLQGRPLHLKDFVVENLFRLFGISKYSLTRGATGEAEFFLGSSIPSTRLASSIGKDVVYLNKWLQYARDPLFNKPPVDSPKYGISSTQLIPLVGKQLYTGLPFPRIPKTVAEIKELMAGVPDKDNKWIIEGWRGRKMILEREKQYYKDLMDDAAKEGKTLNPLEANLYFKAQMELGNLEYQESMDNFWWRNKVNKYAKDIGFQLSYE